MLGLESRSTRKAPTFRSEQTLQQLWPLNATSIFIAMSTPFLCHATRSPNVLPNLIVLNPCQNLGGRWYKPKPGLKQAAARGAEEVLEGEWWPHPSLQPAVPTHTPPRPPRPPSGSGDGDLTRSPNLSYGCI